MQKKEKTQRGSRVPPLNQKKLVQKNFSKMGVQCVFKIVEERSVPKKKSYFFSSSFQSARKRQFIFIFLKHNAREKYDKRK